MISRTYDRGAKRFISLCKMRPVDFVGFPSRRVPKRNACEIDGRILSSRGGHCAAPRLTGAESGAAAIGIARNGLGLRRAAGSGRAVSGRLDQANPSAETIELAWRRRCLDESRSLRVRGFEAAAIHQLR